MSCRFNNSDAVYDAGCPADTVFAFMFWFYLEVDRGYFTNLGLIGRDGASPDASIDIFCNGNGTQTAVTGRNYNGTETNGHDCVVGEWYNLLVQGTTATNGTRQMRSWRRSNSNLIVASGTNGNLGTWPTDSAGRVQFGQIATTSVWLNGRMEAAMLWSGSGCHLSSADWFTQLGYDRPVVNSAQVWGAWTLAGPSSQLDVSGNGRNLTFDNISSAAGVGLLTPTPANRLPRYFSLRV